MDIDIQLKTGLVLLSSSLLLEGRKGSVKFYNLIVHTLEPQVQLCEWHAFLTSKECNFKTAFGALLSL
jgi:hypothetical protein